MEKDRTAIDTITGYYYQFDYYILTLLTCAMPHDTVCIEGIEDVDIYCGDETTAVQCKYYSKTEYNHSIIAKPIRLMLNNFHSNPEKRNNISYNLYGHFKSGQDKLCLPMTIDFLKTKFLSYTKDRHQHEYHTELGLTNTELENFMEHLHVDINAVEYFDQQKKIFQKLQELFRCNSFESEFYYYNNALRLVKQLATEQDVNLRTISSADFITSINQKQYLFDTWYLDFKGIKEYCKTIKSQFFSPMNISPYERFFLIECDREILEQQIKSLLIKISKNWSRLSAREANPFCPYICLHGIKDEKIKNIKQSLQDDGFYFIDGYEFKDAKFSACAITRKPTAHNGIRLKLITEINQIDEILAVIKNTRIIYQFFLDHPYYKNDVYEHHPIKISNTINVENMI